MATIGLLKDVHQGQRVWFDQGDGKVTLTGTVRGMASRHIIDMVIIELDNPVPEYADTSGTPWTHVVLPSSGLRSVY